MELDICFICGIKIGRGNRSEVGSQQKMEKLVSVSNTVEHSSTIISDILSRILNETVMREESVCRICFNLLNDIDYHLKEAQEKTDEITAKFLDKEKELPKYKMTQMMHHRSLEREIARRPHGRLVTTSGCRPDRSINLGQSRNTGHRRRDERVSDQESEVGASSADEMTVNLLAEQKRKLISRVLAPSKRGKIDPPREAPEASSHHSADFRKHSASAVDEQHQEDHLARIKRKKEKKRRRKEKERERRMRFLHEERERREREEMDEEEDGDDEEAVGRNTNKEVVELESESSVPTTHRHANEGMVLRLSDEDEASDTEHRKENTVPKKSKEIRTVDLSQLGDLFSKSSEKQSKSLEQCVVARKSVPTPAALKQMAGVSSYSVQAAGQHRASHVSGPENVSQSRPVDAKTGFAPHEVNSTYSQNLESHPARQHPAQIVVQEQAVFIVEETTRPKFQPQYPTQTMIQSFTNQRGAASQVKHDSENKSMVGAKYASAIDSSKVSSGQLPYTPMSSNFSVNVTETPKTEKKAKGSQGTPSVTCPICQKMFMRGHNMRVHIERVHDKIKRWKCHVCEKPFATTSDLKQHLSSHGLGKIHKCGDCGREFTNRDSVILHRKQHTNERTHVCKLCGKGFFKSSCLVRHMRSHTGEKPFGCVCGRSFSQVATLKTHQKICKMLAEGTQQAVQVVNRK